MVPKDSVAAFAAMLQLFPGPIMNGSYIQIHKDMAEKYQNSHFRICLHLNLYTLKVLKYEEMSDNEICKSSVKAQYTI